MHHPDQMQNCNYILNRKHTYTESCHYALFIPHKTNGTNFTKLAFGVNSSKKNCVSVTTHAEMDALSQINKIKNRPKKVDLLVIRYSKSGKLGESRPCYHCLRRLTNTSIEIKKIYYSTYGGLIECEDFNEMLLNSKTCMSSGFRWSTYKKERN